MKETRIFPLPAKVVIRSALFSLSKMGAIIEANSYQEQSGTIVAKIGKYQHTMSIRVSEVESASMIEVETAIYHHCDKLLMLMAGYVTEGSELITHDAINQWSKLITELDVDRKRTTRQGKLGKMAQEILSFVRKIFSDADSNEKLQITLVDQNEVLTIMSPINNEITIIEPMNTKLLALSVPNNPGMLIKTSTQKIFEIKPDPTVFIDRTSYLQVCEFDNSVYIKGSKYCPNCGSPLSIGIAYKKEIRTNILDAANASVRFSILGFVPSLIFLLLMASTLITEKAKWLLRMLELLKRLEESLGLATTAIGVLGIMLFVSIPSITLGQRAATASQNAKQLLGLRFNSEKVGLGRAIFGEALGWLDIILGLGAFGFALLGLIAKIKGM